MFELIKSYIPLLIPIVSIPLVMRYLISPIVFLKLKKKYVRELTKEFGKSWFDPRDLEALDFLTNYAWKDLSSPFVLSYNSQRLKEQFKGLFIGISSIYNEDREISMEFSVQKLLETLYLLFESLHRDFSGLKLFRLLEKLPVNLFLRVSKVNKSLRIFTRNRIIKTLNRYRVTVKILRIITIPIIGLPIIITQLIFSLLYSTLFEGYLRFIYGIILIKVGYYTIYLYSSRKSSLYKEEFSKQEIIEKGKRIEEFHTTFKERFHYTDRLQSALELLKNELIKEGIVPNKELWSSQIERIYKRTFNTVKDSFKAEMSSENNRKLNFKPLLEIFNKIAKHYYPKSSNPLYQMRVKEAMEFGYFLTTLSLKNIYSLPGIKRVMDKVPLKLIIDINDILNNESVKKYIPHLKKGHRVLTNIQNYYLATRTLLKRGNPAIFAASMVTPLVYQHILNSIKEYGYNTSTLLLIDCFESSILKSNRSRIEKSTNN